MNQTIELLQNHRSIRRFTDQAIAADLFDSLILAGQSAATSSFIQATTVIQVSDPAVREAFVELSGGQKYISSAAEFLVFCADLQRNKQRVEMAGDRADFGWAEQLLTASIDVALFAQNVVIASESAGLGICYIGGIRNAPEQVTELLDLPELVFPLFGLCLGYPDQEPEKKPRLPLAAVVHHDQYGNDESTELAIDQYDAQVKAYYHARTGGKLDFTWSEQMKKQAATQSRPFMLGSLRKKGFITK